MPLTSSMIMDILVLLQLPIMMEHTPCLWPTNATSVHDLDINCPPKGLLIYPTITSSNLSFLVAIWVNSCNFWVILTFRLHETYYLIRYLNETHIHGLFFSSTCELSLTAYNYSDWFISPLNCCSTTSLFATSSQDPISWSLKKQDAISYSYAYTKNKVVTTTNCEIIWLIFLLRDLSINSSRLVLLFCDNQFTLHIARNMSAWSM